MEEFIKSTAIEMETPKAYGAFHLTFFCVGLAIVIPLAYLLAKRLNARQSRILLVSIGVLLLISEAYKQLFYTYVYGGGVYQWYMFPLQLCSMPMYVCLLAPLCRTPRTEKLLYGFLASFVFMGGLVSYMSPEGMCREYLTMTVHSFSWHMIMIFLGLFAIFSRRLELKITGYFKVIPVYYSAGVVAFIINLLCYDKVYYTVGENGVTYRTYVNMFYLGPHRSPLIICRDIWDKAGWVINLICYTSAIVACGFLFYLFAILFDRLRSRIKAKKTAVK